MDLENRFEDCRRVSEPKYQIEKWDCESLREPSRELRLKKWRGEEAWRWSHDHEPFNLNSETKSLKWKLKRLIRDSERYQLSPLDWVLILDYNRWFRNGLLCHWYQSYHWVLSFYSHQCRWFWILIWVKRLICILEICERKS